MARSRSANTGVSRNLAFRIKKNRKGHYVLLNIDAPAAAVHELERNMGLNEDVIRYLTVKVKELEEEPSIMMRSRGGRDDRGGRDRGGRFGGRDRDRGGRDDRRDRPPRDSRPPRSESAGEGKPAEATSGAAPAAASGESS